MSATTDAHNARLCLLDPVLSERAPLDGAADPLIAAGVGGARAEAAARLRVSDPDEPGSIWGALVEHDLELHLAGDDIAVSMAGVLDAWSDRVAETVAPGDWETAATLTVPSRDPEFPNALLARGFAPVGIMAVRLRPRDGAAPARLPSGYAIRPAEPADLDLLADLDTRLLAHDSRFGGVTMRPGARQTLRAGLAERLAAAPGWTWIALRDGVGIGYVHVIPPGVSPASGWTVAGNEAAYVAAMYIDDSERGAGLGAALVETAHAAIDGAGAPITVLSYAAVNPRGAPFWARMGYRPLWTTWQRRPAVLGQQ